MVLAWAVKDGSALPEEASKAARWRWGAALGQLTPMWPSGGCGLSLRQGSFLSGT